VDGYYDTAATHTLDRNLCVIGFLNRVSRAVGTSLSSFIGASCSILDEIVEHRLGAATHEILASSDIEGFRDAEARELRRLIVQAPTGVVVLGEGSLSEPSMRALVRKHAHLMWIRQSLEEIERLLSKGREMWGRTLVAELAAVPGCDGEEKLEALYAMRASEHRSASLTLPVTGSDYRGAARSAIELLESRGVLARAS
jgi:shikimate kinase